MLTASLTKSRSTEGTVEINFSVSELAATHCVKVSEELLLQSTNIKKIRPSARILNISIVHEVDSDGVNLCKAAHLASCRPIAESTLQGLPQVGQAYWKGTEKTFDTRVCVLDTCNCKDFNVSCEVKVSWVWISETRKDKDHEIFSVESILHVKREKRA
jgi:hypothetical protein